ncbi:MAG: adenosylcobinamide-GDP ribazoletransferase [Rhodospirillaceae bacterium]
MIRQLRLLLCAVQFLTRIPVPELKGFAPEWITLSARYFPLVGQIVGAISAVAFFLAAKVWGGAVPAVLAVTAGILVTGAFHEDGLADSADGLGGGRTKDQRLTIMKDSRIGAYGALALMLALALKVTALAQLPALAAVGVLIAGHGAARAAAVVVMAALPYAGDAEAAKYKPVPNGVSVPACLLALVLAVWPFAAFALPNVAPALVIGIVPALVMALMAWRLIGGITGDVLGAVEQMFEIGFFLGAAVQ